MMDLHKYFSSSFHFLTKRVQQVNIRTFQRPFSKHNLFSQIFCRNGEFSMYRMKYSCEYFCLSERWQLGWLKWCQCDLSTSWIFKYWLSSEKWRMAPSSLWPTLRHTYVSHINPLAISIYDTDFVTTPQGISNKLKNYLTVKKPIWQKVYNPCLLIVNYGQQRNLCLLFNSKSIWMSRSKGASNVLLNISKSIKHAKLYRWCIWSVFAE